MTTQGTQYDLLIVGGGINGAGIARDAAVAADDILWRRSKTGLRMSATHWEDFAIWFAGFGVAKK